MKPLLCFTVCLAVSGCATVDLPQNLPDANTAIRATTGAWAVVTTETIQVEKAKYAGELVAVGNDSIYMFWGDTLKAIRKESVLEAKLFMVDPPIWPSGAVFWVILGSASTISHGFGAVISLPLWLILGSVGAAAITADDDAGELGFPAHSWDEFSMFARFPQGFPSELDRAQLRARVRLPSP